MISVPRKLLSLSLFGLLLPAAAGAAASPTLETLGRDERGEPTFVRGELGSLPRGLAAELGAAGFLRSFALERLGATGSESFAPFRVKEDELGQVHVRAQQMLHGMPVVGAELILHADAASGRVLVVNGRFAKDDGAPSKAEIDAAKAFDLALIDFNTRHGRDSLDGNGMTLDSTVHDGSSNDNAFWSNDLQQMVYGDGGGTTFSPLGGALDVVAPERLYPGSCSPNSSNDYCGVHGNSGIANLAFYLVSQGGWHPRGKTPRYVDAIGINAAERIYCRAATLYLGSTSNYSDLRNSLAQAAVDLFGAGSPQARRVSQSYCTVGIGNVDCLTELFGSGTTFGGKRIASLNWKYSDGASVDVFKDGVKVMTTPSDGGQTHMYSYLNTPSTANVGVCHADSTSYYDSNTCSNVFTVDFGSGGGGGF